MDVLRTKLSRQAGVQNVSFCMANPAEMGWQKIPFRWDQSPKNSDFDANVKWAEASWFATYKLSFVAGGPYTPSDTTNGVVVNENLLRRLKITDFPTAIGRMVRIGNGNSAPVVGVVKDFNTTSLRNPIDPVIIAANKKEYRMIAIRIQTTAIQPLLGHIRQIWQQTYPDGVFESDFLDERIASFYSREEQFGKLFRLFTAIAIFISCLGLYALAELRRSCFATLLLARNLRSARLCDCATPAGDGRPESPWSFGRAYCLSLYPRADAADRHCLYHCSACFFFSDAALAG